MTTQFQISDFTPLSLIERAREYAANGLAVTPLKYRTKIPFLDGWQDGGIGEELFEQYFASGEANIGIVLGEPSNGLVDVDLDDPFAIPFADRFLPATDCVFGRKTSLRSHRLYKVARPLRIEKFASNNMMLLELRGTGHCTVFPGSIHVTGEPIEFESGTWLPPKSTSCDVLKEGCTKIAIATLVSKSYPTQSGYRHDLCLALSGYLCKRGWSGENVLALVTALAEQACDPEVGDRQNCVKTTFSRQTAGEPITGRNNLEAFIGPDAVKALNNWCGAGEDAPQTKATAPRTNLTSESSAADEFVQKLGETLIYSDSSQRWFAKNNQVYEPASTETVQGMAKVFLQSEVAKTPELIAHHKTLTSRRHINATVELSRSQFRVSEERFDRDNLLVGCADGRILNLGTAEFETSEAGIVTRKLGTSFDPDAKCQRWEQFLSKIFQDDSELIKFIQRVAGYSLSGDTSGQCLFILTGTGANGKSTFLNILSKLLGDYAATTPMMTLMDSRYGQQQTSDLARLAGCRFVTASEGERGQKLAESRIKLMTGRDIISCRYLYQEYFEYQPQFKIFLSTNELPEVAGIDEAIWRRIRLIEFPVTIPESERDLQLADKLVLELPGILNWALSGYHEYANEGLTPPEQVLKATRHYRDENDSIGQWLEDCCDLHPQSEAPVRSLHKSYVEWCEANGSASVSNIRFGKELTRRGFGIVRKGTGNWRKGISLRAEEFYIPR